MQSAVDILILSNGPGELATWVKPVVQELRDRLGNDRQQVRISAVLSPCSNANGQEAAVARRYPEVDRVQAAEHFFPFLLWGKTQDRLGLARSRRSFVFGWRSVLPSGDRQALGLSHRDLCRVGGPLASLDRSLRCDAARNSRSGPGPVRLTSWR